MAKTRLGPNLSATVDGDVLTLKIKMDAKGSKSKSGKSKVISKTTDRIQFLTELGSEYSNYGLIFNLFKTKKSPKKKKKKK